MGGGFCNARGRLATTSQVLTSGRQVLRWIVGAVALGGLIAFPAVVEAEDLPSERPFLPTVPGRYGMSFIPWTVACLALVAGERRFLRTMATVLVAGALIVFLSVYGIFNLADG